MATFNIKFVTRSKLFSLDSRVKFLLDFSRFSLLKTKTNKKLIISAHNPKLALMHHALLGFYHLWMPTKSSSSACYTLNFVYGYRIIVLHDLQFFFIINHVVRQMIAGWSRKTLLSSTCLNFFCYRKLAFG